MDEYCARCSSPLTVSVVSRFNTDVICLACEAKERAHPKYQEAIAAERTAADTPFTSGGHDGNPRIVPSGNSQKMYSPLGSFARRSTRRL